MLNSGMKRICYLVLLLNRKFLIPIQTALRQLISASLLKGCLVFGHYPHERSWITAMYKLSKSHFSTNPNRGNILVKLRADGEFIRIRTFDRAHGGSRSFIVRREALWKLPEGETAIDSDLDGFLEAFVRNEMVQMRFYWISVNNDVISGYKQSFEIPLTLILRVLNSRDMMAKYLHRATKKPTRFHAVRAANTLRTIQQDDRIHRAFSKGMRDHFHWPGDTVTLYSDGDHDLYFTAESGFPANGGLILHEGSVNTVRGTFPKLQYSVHT